MYVTRGPVFGLVMSSMQFLFDLVFLKESLLSKSILFFFVHSGNIKTTQQKKRTHQFQKGAFTRAFKHCLTTVLQHHANTCTKLQHNVPRYVVVVVVVVVLNEHRRPSWPRPQKSGAGSHGILDRSSISCPHGTC